MALNQTKSEAPPRFARGRDLIAFVVAGAFFMEFLDGTVIATAIPQMAVTFGVRPVDLGIGVSAYVLTLAVLLPASGWVAGRLGPRAVFAGALAGFTLASLLCAASNSLPFFVGARILQGAAGAMMVPVGRLAVLRTTAKPDLMRAIAILTWPALMAPIIAPPVGGFATTYATWRWVFLINLPFGVAGVLLALRLFPNAADAERRPLDWRGFVLTGIACFLLMYGTELVARPAIDWLAAILCIAAGLLAGAASLRSMRRAVFPLLDFSVLSIPSFAASMVGGSLFRMAVSTVPFLLPLMFQVGFGYDAFHSGLLILPVFVGNIVIKPATSAILRRLGFRTVLIGNGLLASAAIAACALLRPETPLAITTLILFIGGVARSMQLTTINTIAFGEVPTERMSSANTLFNMMQQISLGLGVVAGVIALRVAHQAFATVGSAPSPRDFQLAFLLVSLIGLAAAADAFRLPKRADPSFGNISR